MRRSSKNTASPPNWPNARCRWLRRCSQTAAACSSTPAFASPCFRAAAAAPEPGNLDQLYRLGQLLGRLHAVGATRPFEHRAKPWG